MSKRISSVFQKETVSDESFRIRYGGLYKYRNIKKVFKIEKIY